MVVQMTYKKNECCLYGFEKYFEEAEIEVEDVLIIRKSGDSEWFVDLIKRNGIGFMKSFTCTTEISDSMMTNHLRCRKRNATTADLECLTIIDETKGTYLIMENHFKLN